VRASLGRPMESTAVVVVRFVPKLYLLSSQAHGVYQVCKDTYAGVLYIPYYGGDGRYRPTNTMAMKN